MKLIVYSKIVRKVSGMQTFERAFLQKMKRSGHELTYVYDAGDPATIKEFGEYATVIKNEKQVIRGDLCIFSSIHRGENNIQVKKKIQVCHSEYSQWGVKFDPSSSDVYVAVGEGVAKDLKDHYSVEAIVIPNLLPEQKTEKVLRLITASRIQRGKGFCRMAILAEALKESGRKFEWLIYGSGARTFTEEMKKEFKNIPEVVFMGARTNIQSYMVDADYLVQLSNSEGFCYSVYEALQVKTPVIVTRWHGVEKIVKEGYNGRILEMTMSNINIEQLFDEIPKYVKLEVKNSVLSWTNLFYTLSNDENQNT